MKKIILIILFFFNLIPILEKDGLNITGPQSAVALGFGEEEGGNNPYENMYNMLSDFFGLDIVDSHVNSNGQLVFELADDSIFILDNLLNEVIVTPEIVTDVINEFPDYTPPEPVTEENAEEILEDFIEWYTDHTSQIPDPTSNAQNNVTDPCMKALVDNVINGDGAENPFSNILKTTFGSGSDINITFNQYNDPTKTDEDGKAGGSQYHLEVGLNLAALDYSSNENITATIYHEIIHAYLYTNGIPKGQHHDIIANEWRDVISSQLQADYPNLSQADADALAWGGLNETQAWQQMYQSDQTNNTGITGAIAQTIQNHKNLNNQNNGTHGTHCN